MGGKESEVFEEVYRVRRHTMLYDLQLFLCFCVLERLRCHITSESEWEKVGQHSERGCVTISFKERMRQLNILSPSIIMVELPIPSYSKGQSREDY